jgi:hypothetical protein
MSKILLIFTILLLIIPRIVFSQPEEEINVAGLRLLDYNTSIPDDILQQRTAVLVTVPPKSAESSERGDWKRFSASAHEYFKKIGIDAVIYFYLDDITAGSDASVVYASYMKSREIKYLVILSKSLFKIGSRTDTTNVILITKFNGESTFISNSQKAWKDQSKDLDKLMKNVYRITVRQDFKRTNNLIIDHPEFIGGLKILKSLRNESFPTDLRIDKLAVPKYVPIPVPSDIPNGGINKKVIREMEEYNSMTDRNNVKLESVFGSYPWKYELVDYNLGEEQLFNNGYQYLLLQLNTSGYSIHEMLGYEIKSGETDYITVKKKPDGNVTFRSIPVDAPVYKFYIKQLARKEIYIGEIWDADETWEEALGNFLRNLETNLKK